MEELHGHDADIYRVQLRYLKDIYLKNIYDMEELKEELKVLERLIAHELDFETKTELAGKIHAVKMKIG